MKVLWLTNIPLPEASLLMEKPAIPYGGWLISMSKDLVDQDKIELTIAFPQEGISSFKKLEGKKITYYAFKIIKDNDVKLTESNIVLKEIIEEVKPDIVHIFGTELAHTLSMVITCKKEDIEMVISIQGLVSIIEKHMFANLPFSVVYGVTLRNFVRRDNVMGLKKLFIKRGKNEIEAIKKVNHIIGRTTWDKACSLQINDTVQYHFCNETLREEFYKHQWKSDKCIKHSIFLSQGQYPIKGLHYVLEAMPSILSKYPDAKIYISGKDITKSDKLKDRVLMTYYGKYIKKMIKKLNIENSVVFTGPLNEKEMCERYLKSNVFVCPSSIENSPNSLGEAMILGVPCIASNVGGVSDMLKHKEEGFIYQHDAPYMLAYYVCEMFGNNDFAMKFSEKAREYALRAYDREANTKRLIAIYNRIVLLKKNRR